MLELLAVFCLASGDVVALHADALALVRTGNIAGARGILDRVRALAPGSAYCDLIDGHCHLNADRGRAEALYRRAVERARAQECTADTTADGGAVADALHATARLLRVEERWAEAADVYAAALAVRPSSQELAQEAGFVSAKAAFSEGRVADAAAALTAALGNADGGVWAPHLHRELAHARGLLGDTSAAAEHYAKAIELGGFPGGHLAMGEAFAALAAHHERSHATLGQEARLALKVAADCLRHSADAYARELQAAVAAASASDALGQRVARLPQASRGEQVQATTGAVAAAAANRTAEACFRLGRTMEALCGVGEPTGVPPVVASAIAGLRGVAISPGNQTDATRADAVDRLQIARQLFEQAVALRPSHAASHESLGRNLLGASSLCNYGAQAVGALHADEAEAHLRSALRLAPEGDVEGIQTVLDAIEQTRREVALWEEVVRAEGGRDGGVPAPVTAAADGVPDEPQPHAAPAAAWHPSILGRSSELPRVTVRTIADLEAVLRKGEPAVLLGLQQGFAPREAWTPAALRQDFGQLPVKVSVSPSNRFDGPEPGAWWGLGIQADAEVVEEVLVRPPETHMRLGDVLSLLAMRTPERFYVEYAAMHQVRRGLPHEEPPPPIWDSAAGSARARGAASRVARCR